MTEEQWAPIPTEPLYMASTLGRIKRTRHTIVDSRGRARVLPERVLSGSNTEGYIQHRLKSGRCTFAHILVLETFVGPCPDGFECAHRNTVRNDNRLENLRWTTHSDNLRDCRPMMRASCPRGHEYTVDNTYVNRGKRYCRTCKRDAKRSARAIYG